MDKLARKTRAQAPKRRRRAHSWKDELLCKAREAALCALQIFNNPQVSFKAESYTMLMVVAWTYLLHAYFRSEGVEYRYVEKAGKRRRFKKTKHGAFRYWELETCLKCNECPLSSAVKNNLRFIIGLRHEIEHQMTNQDLDAYSARFQACCLNFHNEATRLFGDKYGIADQLPISLQLSSFSSAQMHVLKGNLSLPGHIQEYIEHFDESLSDSARADPAFAYRIIMVRKLVNHTNQADEVIEFVPAGSEVESDVNKRFFATKEVERPKFLPGDIVKRMRDEGHASFSMYDHTQLWKDRGAKDLPGMGVQVGKTWYWYDRWLIEVRAYCEEQHQ